MMQIIKMQKTKNIFTYKDLKYFVVCATISVSQNLWSEAVPLLATEDTITIKQESISAEEYKIEIENHRKRVRDSALELAQFIFSNRHQDSGIYFLRELYSQNRSLAMSMLSSYFYYHDWPKLERYFFEKLYANYGKEFTQRPDFIDELNANEKKIKDQFLRNVIEANSKIFERVFNTKNSDQILERMNAELKWIEDIADFTDTKIFRGKELGFKYTVFAAAKLFRSNGDIAAAYYSHWLERNIIKRSAAKRCQALFL